jgi:hypothetical protein
MSVVQIRNDMPTGIRMRVFGMITDDLRDSPDVAHQYRRFVLVGAINDIELPGGGAVTQLDSAFWSQWSSQNANADFVRGGLVHQVGYRRSIDAVRDGFREGAGAVSGRAGGGQEAEVDARRLYFG